MNQKVEFIYLSDWLVNQQSMSRYLVTRVRHVLEATTVEATSGADAIAKSRKLKRSDWNHVDSKRRRAYKADAVDMNHTGRTR